MAAVNAKIAGGFGAVLVLTGISGFLPIPGPMSNAAAYNVFHIVFGLIGIGCWLSKKPAATRGFNVGFGLIDLYQAAAHWLGLFPIAHFRWTRADDALHVAIGIALVLAGILWDD